MISIVVPVYNVEKYIERTLQSLVNQTYNDYEIILVDDGGTDHSIEIAKEVLQKANFKNYKIISELNAGQGIARNNGVNHANGEWIFFMDADDIIHPQTLEIMKKETQKVDCEVVFCGFLFAKEYDFDTSECSYTTRYYDKKEMQFAYLTRQKKLLVPGTLYKKDWLIYNKLIFPSIRYSEDSYYLWTLLEKAKCIVEVDYPLYIYIVRGDSTMVSPKIKDILEGYNAFKYLSNAFQSCDDIIPEVKKWILSRWVLGVLRASAGNLCWNQYKQFSTEVLYKRHCCILKGFPDIRVQVMRLLCLFDLKIFYTLMKKVNPYNRP